jgi:hypothetical protein
LKEHEQEIDWIEKDGVTTISDKKKKEQEVLNTS